MQNSNARVDGAQHKTAKQRTRGIIQSHMHESISVSGPTLDQWQEVSHKVILKLKVLPLESQNVLQRRPLPDVTDGR